ncbi:MAG: type IV pilus biogenesis/stability protein PilW [Rubrivivax sp.]|nr:type IV pilus biogenesis/stability protein PilW [Rubrivivax sp.]
MLGGCATPPAPETQVRTASDMTDLDRRAKLHMELAAGYFGRGQTNVALDEVKKALAVRPELPEAYSLRALIYASMGQPQLAEESFRQALKLNPRDADSMHNFGWFLCQERRYADAEAQFDGAMAQPQYRDAARSMLAKGLCQAREGRYDVAEATLMRAYEMAPTNPATAFNLAEVLYRQGQYERARFYLRRVNSQPASANAQTLWLAARVERKLGNVSGARDLGNQLRARFPQSAEALRFESDQFDD